MLSVLMHCQAQIRVQSRTVALLVLAVTALTCIVGLASPVMADSVGQDCFGAACGDQIGCGQPAQPQTSSGSLVHLVALPAAVERDLVLARTETRSVGPPSLKATGHSFVPVAPRSPPAA